MYVVSSPGAGEGKTTVVSNLGVALSQSQRRVVILDGDLRKPGLHLAFGIANTTGLRNLLRGEINPLTAPLELFCRKTSVANLSIVTSGSGNEEVTELLHSPRTADLLQRLGEEFDLVLIDSPPMLHMADARIFADHTDGVILVFRSGVTNLDQAQAAHGILVHDRVRVLGSILNDFDPAREGMSGYYKSYYQYQDAAEAIATKRVRV
jgi:capsular exopolysaccharide synthesis family protein